METADAGAQWMRSDLYLGERMSWLILSQVERCWRESFRKISLRAVRDLEVVSYVCVCVYVYIYIYIYSVYVCVCVCVCVCVWWW